MAYIYLKGYKEDPIEVDNKSAISIKLEWEQCTITHKHAPVDIGGLSVLTSEIKAIKLDEDLDKRDNWKAKENLYWEERKHFLSRPIEQRAELSLKHFLFALLVHTGRKEINDTQKQYVKKIISDFFVKNPTWCVPSAEIYKPIFDKLNKEGDYLQQRFDKNDFGYQLKMSGLRCLENVEANELEIQRGKKPKGISQISFDKEFNQLVAEDGGF